MEKGVAIIRTASCVVFLVHGTILQQWTSLLKNSANIKKRKNLASDRWRIVPVTVGQSFQWLLNNRASDGWRIELLTVEQPCQTFLKLVKEHFQCSNIFHKIFNKNTIKISYSCVRNITSITASHNKFILRRKAREYGCNCRDKESLRSDMTTIYEILIMNVTLNADRVIEVHLAVKKK